MSNAGKFGGGGGSAASSTSFSSKGGHGQRGAVRIIYPTPQGQSNTTTIIDRGLPPYENYLISYSLRFDGSADYLGWSPAADGDMRKWTWSGWVKRHVTGTFTPVFGASSSTSAPYFYFSFSATSGEVDTLRLDQVQPGPIVDIRVKSQQTFASTDTWYHVIVSYDAANTNAADRVKWWVNGQSVDTDETNGRVYPSSTQDTFWNDASHTMYLGRNHNGYGKISLAEVHFLDGYALQETSPSITVDTFGETRDGVWLPKEVTGVTYGNNGFYLDFANSSTAADLGNDVSGKNNDFSVNGITPDDQLIDTPNLRFATWDPSTGGSTNAYREGNLLVDIGSTPDEAVSTMGVSSGKIYAEYYWKQGAYFFPKIAIGTTDSPSDYSGFWSNDGNKYDVPTGSTSYGSSFSVGSIISVAVDANTGTVWWAVNGSWQGGATVSEIEAGTTTNAAKTGLSGTIYVRADDGSSADQSTEVVINFGQDHTFAGEKSALTNPYSDANGVGEFYYEPPSGFLALATEYK